ncbi:MAG TPA: hypothetical protein PKE55_00525 [Kiritimatiellia bacterium]|nr:hypothetical protein [Kiritimatiellia bacterium]
MPSGARILTCVPASGWNGDLIVFARGYTAFTEPLDFQNLEIGGIYLPEVAQRLGFAFATSTYRTNGLAVLSGLEDLRQATLAFPWVTGKKPRRTFIVGVSEGGLIAVLALERYPELFAGGYSLCGPIGNFQRQAQSFANFRVLFDVYFPDLLPGGATDVPNELIASWSSLYRPLIESAVLNNLNQAEELLQVSGVAYVPGDPATLVGSVTGMLWYHTFGTANAQQVLRGNPFGNETRIYRGSSDDAALNAAVERVRADPITASSLRPYETTGKLRRPLVALHTTGDEIVPFWHQRAYFAKTRREGSEIWSFPIDRYGHCQFEFGELIGGLFWMLVLAGR